MQSKQKNLIFAEYYNILLYMKKRNRNILLIVIIGIILIGTACAGTLYITLFKPAFKTSAEIYIDRDDTVDSVFRKMQKIASPTGMQGFKWLDRYYGYGKNIRTGRYTVKPGDNMYHVFRRLVVGYQTPINISFNNIRTREQLAQVLAKQLMIDSAEIARPLHDSAFCARMGYKDETIISMFIPNTYEVYWDITADKLLGRMQKEHERFWNKSRLDKAKAIGMTPEEVSTLASIVEEETNNNAEKPMVAGLYINRLNKGMLLQADPTVKFALQDFGLKRIYNAHLNVDSPYNTYKHTGLPPGPIRIPSIKGIDSVLNYAKHNYIYMCAKEDFSGTHNFATNMAQHQANARKYWNALNARNIK